MHTKASDADIQSFLSRNPNWTFSDDGLQRSYRFADFVAAFGWMSQVALIAERQGHHPEWRNVWAFVDVTLRTHDAGDVVTDADLQLADAMERAASPLLQATT